jgi:hypothetical protein
VLPREIRLYAATVLRAANTVPTATDAIATVIA